MTIDWFVWLTPLALAVVLLPFVFVGCPAFGTAPPAPGDAPTGTGPGTAPPTTELVLTLDTEIQNVPKNPDGTPKVPRLVRVAATWVLSKQNPGSPPVTDVQETKTAVPKTPPLLDPAKDDAPKWIADDAKVGTRDRVTCICDVELENGELRQAKIENKVLTLHHSHVFKLGRLAFSSPDFRVTLEQA